MKKIALGFILLLALCFVMVSLPEINIVKASGTIYIRSDGSVEGTDKIQRDGNVYTFTDNIYDSIVVEHDNIVINGANFTLQGTGGWGGIYIEERSNVAVKNIEIKRFYTGIVVSNSSNIIISGNKITANEGNGIALGFSSSNTLSGNTITDNGGGINLVSSCNTTLSGNVMNRNTYGSIDMLGSFVLKDFLHSIDTSNLVDGKPVYYFVNRTNLMINPAAYPQVGYLALVNCDNVTVEDMTLTNNDPSLVIAYTNNSRIIGNNIISNRNGIHLSHSSNNTISKNNIPSSSDPQIANTGLFLRTSSNNNISGNTILEYNYGILVMDSSNHNTISGNNVTKNGFGIDVYASSNNILFGNDISRTVAVSSKGVFQSSGVGIWLEANSTYNQVYENNVTNNGEGIRVWESSNNTFYHNNFINNTVQARTDGSIGTWDNGSEGNYWDDYAGVDGDGDGIGDTPYIIDENNQDNYPLMNPVVNPEFPDDEKPTTPTTETFPTTWIVATIVIVAVAGAALLVYFGKVKKTTGKTE